MKLLRNVLLILATLLLIILFFNVTPKSPVVDIEFQLFSAHGLHFHGITSNYHDSTFSSRVISYFFIILFYLSLSKDTRIVADRLLMILACSGLITELYNWVNISYIHGWTSVLHWDILLVFLLINRIYKLDRKKE